MSIKRTGTLCTGGGAGRNTIYMLKFRFIYVLKFWKKRYFDISKLSLRCPTLNIINSSFHLPGENGFDAWRRVPDGRTDPRRWQVTAISPHSMAAIRVERRGCFPVSSAAMVRYHDHDRMMRTTSIFNVGDDPAYSYGYFF